MNFIREVVDLVHENSTVDVLRNIENSISECKEYKSRVHDFIDKSFVKFEPELQNNAAFTNESNHILNKITDLTRCIDTNETQLELVRAEDSLQEKIKYLKELEIELRVAQKILMINTLFETLEKFDRANLLQHCKIILKLSELITKDNSILSQLEAFESINFKYCYEKVLATDAVRAMFENAIDLNEKKFSNTKTVSIKIDLSQQNAQHDLCTAITYIDYKLNEFADRLFDSLIVPIITKPVSLQVNTNDQLAMMTLSYSQKDMDLQPSYSVVLNELKIMFGFLQNMNLFKTDSLTIYTIIAAIVREKFIKLLLTKCLSNAIPNKLDETIKEQLSTEILNFNQFLLDIEFLDSEDDDLKIFCQNIGLVAKNRFCQAIYRDAVAIMKKDFHDMTYVPEEQITGCYNEHVFPRMMVSKTILELIQLLEQVAKEATAADVNFRDKLFGTISEVIELFITEVPSHHSKMLAHIPQQTALFHNNCMLLAYWLAVQHEKKQTQFAIDSATLEQLGTDYMRAQVDNQQQQIQKFLKDFDLTNATSSISTATLKSIRCCLRQLELLKNVWETVLSNALFVETMGNLLDSVCACIIQRVVAMEDISATVGNSLADLCTLVLSKSELFTNQQDPSDIVTSWTKFKHLKWILEASLAEITDTWSHSQSNLRASFQAEEVRHLIRALFRNTDRRADALAMIFA